MFDFTFRPAVTAKPNNDDDDKRDAQGSNWDDDSSDALVWDNPDPFGPPDPELAALRRLLDAEIAKTRRFESIGPLDPVPDDVESDHSYDSDSSYADCCDGSVLEADDEDDGVDDEDDEDRSPARIVVPRLLPVPLRFLDSPVVPPPTPVDNDTAEEKERIARKAKRDAHRSRAKALAVLGPEASRAIQT